MFCGPKLRLPGKGKGDHQEFDFVIIDLKLKTVIGIESKQTLNMKTGVSSDKSATAQTQRLQELLEQYPVIEEESSRVVLEKGVLKVDGVEVDKYEPVQSLF